MAKHVASGSSSLLKHCFSRASCSAFPRMSLGIICHSHASGIPIKPRTSPISQWQPREMKKARTYGVFAVKNLVKELCKKWENAQGVTSVFMSGILSSAEIHMLKSCTSWPSSVIVFRCRVFQELSGETAPADSLFLDFQPPGPRRETHSVG